jgi:hypothetical protein
MKPMLSAAFVLALAGSALGQATFDAQSEGTFSTVISDGGFTFRDMDMRIPGENPPFTMAIEDASGTLAGVAGFTPPNVLGFGGYSEGPGCGFGRLGSVRIIPPAPASGATIEVFEFGSEPGNSVVFAGYLNGQEVARATTPILPCCAIHHYPLSISGAAFDELRLFGEGPGDQGVFFGLIDTVATGGGEPTCYPNCDQSTAPPVLNVLDFNCFLNRFSAGDSYANCDGSTAEPALNVLDFNCFLNAFSAGCSAP